MAATQDELDRQRKEALAKAEAADLVALWQAHRTKCLELAALFGADHPGTAITTAEVLSKYILNGIPQQEKKNE